MYTAQKMKFSKSLADLVTFTEETLNRKVCSGILLFLYVSKQILCKMYGYITQEFLGLRMRKYFYMNKTYREIFKSALVYL